MRKDCQNLGALKPKLSFAAIGDPDGARAEAALGLVVCQDHASVNPDDYVDSKGWRQLTEAMLAQGLAPPDRSTLKVHFDTVS